jgi:hypothetical protein
MSMEQLGSLVNAGNTEINASGAAAGKERSIVTQLTADQNFGVSQEDFGNLERLVDDNIQLYYPDGATPEERADLLQEFGDRLEEYILGTPEGQAALEGAGLVSAGGSRGVAQADVKALTTTDVMMRYAAVTAALVSTMNAMKSVLSMASLNDLMNAQQLSFSAAKKEKEAAKENYDATVIKAKYTIAAAATQMAISGIGSAMSMCGGVTGAVGGILKDMAQPVAQIISAVGEIVSAGHKLQADMAMAESKELQAMSQTSSAYSQREQESVGQLQQAIQAALQALKSMIDTMGQTTGLITQNMGK